MFSILSVPLLIVVQIDLILGQWGFAVGAAGARGPAYCTFDTRCYGFRPGCSIAHKARPFLCVPGVSCEECLNLCQQSLNGFNWRTCCKSVVYDTNNGICNLYNCPARGNDFKAIYGHNYFQPTFMPNCLIQATTPAAGTAAPAAVCKEGETAKLIAVQDYAVGSINGKDVPGVNADACAKACLSGKLPDGSAFPCKSAQFKDGKCTLSQDAPKSEADQTKSPGSTFYRLYCFPSDLVKGCPDIFTEAPQKILVGQNKQTVDKASLDECIKACLTAEKDHGFQCKSGMFYYNDNKLNCILNVESAKTKPDLFTDAAAEDKEVYFELGCGGGKKYSDAVKRKTKTFKDALEDIPVHGPWGLWSGCGGLGTYEYRFRQCPQKDSRDCGCQRRLCGAAKEGKIIDCNLPGRKHSKGSGGSKESERAKGSKGGGKLVENTRKKDQVIRHD